MEERFVFLHKSNIYEQFVIKCILADFRVVLTKINNKIFEISSTYAINFCKLNSTHWYSSLLTTLSKYEIVSNTTTLPTPFLKIDLFKGLFYFNFTYKDLT